MNGAEGIQPAKAISHDSPISPTYKTLEDIIAQHKTKLSAEEEQELAKVFIEYLSESGGKYFEDVGEMYESVKGENIIVRREDPRVVVDALAKDHSIELHTKPNTDPYPNAVEWNYDYGTKGLENAFLEGLAQMNGIVTVVGFNPKHVKKVVIQNERKSVVNPGGKIIDRSHVVSVDGTVPKEDIRFIVTKIPSRFLPDDESEQKYVFRGVLFGDRESTSDTVH